MTPEEIINAWAEASCKTLQDRDVEAHMDLISRSVKVYGLANHEYIDYNFWLTQVKEQFAEGLLASARYYLHSFRAESDSLIVFTAMEYLTDKDGKEDASPLEIVLFKEEDGVWRVTQQKVLTQSEAEMAGLRGSQVIH